METVVKINQQGIKKIETRTEVEKKEADNKSVSEIEDFYKRR